MAEANTFEPGWFRSKDYRDLTAAYYRELRLVIRSHPAEVALVQCRKCKIRFLTTIRNHNREDMRCPTGCRRKQESDSSAKRSAAYYGTEKGRLKKKEHNRRRHLKSAHAKQRQEDGDLIRHQNPSGLLKYYQWIILVVDGILMNGQRLKELVEGIREKVSQRGRDDNGDARYIRDD